MNIPDCPLCGGPAKLVRNNGKYGIVCRWCGVGMEFDTEEEVVENWEKFVKEVYKDVSKGR